MENIFVHTSWSKHLTIYLKTNQLFKKFSIDLQLADLMLDKRLGQQPKAWGGYPSISHCLRWHSELLLGCQIHEIMSCKILLHSGIIIELDSPHGGPSATGMTTHWALCWGWSETVGRNKIEGLTPACMGLISSLGTDTCGIIKEQIKSKHRDM